jgi:hypothetical protein
LGGGEGYGRILSKPETATSLHSQETIAVEEDVVDLVETKSNKFCLGGMENKGGGCSQRSRLKILSKRWCVPGADYLVKRGVMPIYMNKA